MKIKNLMDYEIPKKEDKENKSKIAKRAWKLLAAFLVFMILLSVVTRSVDSMSVAVVETTAARASVLENSFSVNGQVSTNQNVAVSVVSGIKIGTVDAIQGREVEEGDVLFTLDEDSLKEVCLKAEQEYRKLLYNKEDTEINEKEAARKKEVSLTRAEEDYEIELRKTNKNVSDAWKKVEEADSKLNSFDWSKYRSSSSSSAASDNSVSSGAPDFSDGSSGAFESEDSSDPVLNQLLRSYGNAQTAELARKQELEYAGNAIYDAVRRFEMDFDYLDLDKVTVSAYADQQVTYNRQIHDNAYAASGGTDPEGTTSSDPVIQAQMEAIRSSVINTIMESDSSYQNLKKSYAAAVEERENAKKTVEDYKKKKEEEKEAEAKANASAAASGLSEDLSASADNGVEAYNALVEAYNSAYDAYLNAVQEAKDFDVTGKRSIEDQKAPEESKKEAEYAAETELELKKLELEKLNALKDAKGEIKATASGVIKEVKVTTGDTSPDGVCVLIADKASGYVFTGTITKDQTKYIKVGSTINLESVYQGENVKVQAMVDEINSSLENSEEYQIRASVIEGDVGTSATMKVENKTEKFDSVVPNTAIHQGNGKAYVFVVKENKGVLGTSLTAEKVEVTVKEKDENNSAIEGGGLVYDSKVIVSSNRNLNAGDRVRLSEQ